MKSRKLYLPLLVLLAWLLTACSTVPFAPTKLTEVKPRSAAELVAGQWSTGKGILVVRQSAVFELHGMKVPVAGLMKLDTAAHEARLVGMNEMGVKLYDISVYPDKSEAHFVMPELARYPKFAEAVGTSVRRIFLEPLPSPDDRLTMEKNRYLLTRKSGGDTVSFVFGGPEAQLLEKSGKGKSGSWRVRYYQYQDLQGIVFPGGIVLDDDGAGYRLTLWIESVEKSDE
jgi:hypothetical protein